MKKLFVLFASLYLSGCATVNGQQEFNPVEYWRQASDAERTAWIVSGAILIGANIIKNSNDHDVTNNLCVSTQSLRTGCSRFFVFPAEM